MGEGGGGGADTPLKHRLGSGMHCNTHVPDQAHIYTICMCQGVEMAANAQVLQQRLDQQTSSHFPLQGLPKWALDLLIIRNNAKASQRILQIEHRVHFADLSKKSVTDELCNRAQQTSVRHNNTFTVAAREA